ncbi:DUF58 domain-containing protein [Polycladidibacter stylochi]|uniref:DUF58 domain-containing protein n=1 Tax=Polycladidibacter stylochi TaxID=1807766 RepID=UPI00083702B3|nr:DUF58 domain-containing protein [Pseudovibrio stylochi]
MPFLSASSAKAQQGDRYDNFAAHTINAQQLAARLPDLLIKAQKIAATLTAGWHGRRRSGPGETFWQFRPFMAGEAANSIDWRRSARDNHYYVREKEWEAAQTLWVWPDLTPSMAYTSSKQHMDKASRAIVLALALAQCAARSGERVGIPRLTSAKTGHSAAQNLAQALMRTLQNSTDNQRQALPETGMMKPQSQCVIISDFLDPVAQTQTWLHATVAKGVKGHLLQLLDPAEEQFPFAGRTEFTDPETGTRLLSGKAQNWQQAYQEQITRHKQQLRQLCTRSGWAYTLHHTNTSASTPMLSLFAQLQQNT